VGSSIPHTTRRRQRDQASLARRARQAEKRHLTPEQKRQRRQEHADRIARALAYVETEQGFREWLQARELNPQLTPLSAALAALQAPGQIIGTFAQWKAAGAKVRKGQEAAVYLTRPPFWPLAAWTAEQTDAPPELVEAPPPALPENVEDLAEQLRAAFARDGRKTATLNAFTEQLDA
jgi:hypothetical protein